MTLARASSPNALARSWSASISSKSSARRSPRPSIRFAPPSSASTAELLDQILPRARSAGRRLPPARLGPRTHHRRAALAAAHLLSALDDASHGSAARSLPTAPPAAKPCMQRRLPSTHIPMASSAPCIAPPAPATLRRAPGGSPSACLRAPVAAFAAESVAACQASDLRQFTLQSLSVTWRRSYAPRKPSPALPIIFRTG